MIRATGADDREEIEVYHDRIRETVLSELPADNLRSLHRNLALALEASKHVDPERLVTHFQEAGDDEKAAEYAIAAAEKASEALAFDRAARLYALALGLRRTGDGKETANGERRTGRIFFRSPFTILLYR